MLTVLSSEILSLAVCFSADAAAAAVGVDAHCEGGGILPSFPPSLPRAIAGEDHGPPSSAAAGRSGLRSQSVGRSVAS